jgi:hypothetical protein
MKKIFSTIPYLLIAVLVGVTAVYAGNLTPPGPAANTMYSLTDIFNLAVGTTTTEGSGAIPATPGTVASTGKTLTEVYDAIAGEIAAINPATVLTGTTIFGVSGSASSGGLPKTGQFTPDWNYVNGDDAFYADPAGADIGLPQGLGSWAAVSANGGRFTDNTNGTITDNATGLMWVKQPELIIPGAEGVHPSNQAQVARGNWATNTLYTAGDLVNDSIGGVIYVAAITHTSGLVDFATDQAANPTYWRQTVWSNSAVDLITPKTMNWSTSILNCEALEYAGYTNWRLPNIKELVSIVDYSLSSPAIDINFFPDTKSNIYFSSTTNVDNDFRATIVDFSTGSVTGLSYFKANTHYVRCVR